MSSYITRAERSGNIFYRTTGLIRSGQLSWADRPLWYDVYVAQPPLTPPDWNVKLPKYDEPVRKIFYEEDVVRAAFYKKFKRSGIINCNNKVESASQIFIKEYFALKKESDEQGKGLEHQELFSLTEKRLEELGKNLN
ncbi:unnamed protein product [Auanema sp. JU1783]|nr:unnamed protein product [Auanema sp. JU1783]